MNQIIDLYNKHCDDYKETEGCYFKDGDQLYYISGFFFLIQNRGCNWNNVVAFKYRETDTSLIDVIKTFVNFCRMDNIEYLRVESNKNRWLPFFERLGPKINCSFIKDIETSNLLGREVIYVCLVH